VVGGVMFVSTPYGRVVALDAETGKQRWAYECQRRPARHARGVLLPGGKKSRAGNLFGTARDC